MRDASLVISTAVLFTENADQPNGPCTLGTVHLDRRTECGRAAWGLCISGHSSGVLSNREYLDVDYKTGPSYARGLERKTANGSGMMTWETYTSIGHWRATISVGSRSISLTLTVI